MQAQLPHVVEVLFLRQEVADQQSACMNEGGGGTGKLNTGRSAVSAFGLERAGLCGFIFAVSFVCVTS